MTRRHRRGDWAPADTAPDPVARALAEFDNRGWPAIYISLREQLKAHGVTAGEAHDIIEAARLAFREDEVQRARDPAIAAQRELLTGGMPVH